MANNVMTLRPAQAQLPARLRNDIAQARANLAPMDPKALAVKLNQTLALWPKPAEFETTAEFYLEALETVPADLVEKALKHVRLNSKFFPKPAELLEPIRAEMTQRRESLRDAEGKARNYRPPEPEITEAERREGLRLFAEIKGSLKRMETHADDLV